MQIGKCQLIGADGAVVADDQLYDRSTFADHPSPISWRWPLIGGPISGNERDRRRDQPIIHKRHQRQLSKR